jgi:hypothetical protein
MRGTQQSEIVNQKQNNLPPKNFEEQGNMGMEGFDMSSFSPQ